MKDVYIQSIETLVPPNEYPQSFVNEKMRSLADGEKERRIIDRVYKNSGIETRYSVLDDFLTDTPQGLFKEGASGKIVEPGTKERNDRFAKESKTLSVEAAGRVIENSQGVSAEDITHVITTSCTGFSNPGPDYFIVRDLGLKRSTARFALGFMGCYAAVPALRMAHDFCMAEPSAVVLVVCIELCTLHLRFENGLDSLLANAIFSDGVAAAIVSAKAPASNRPALRLDSFASNIVPEGEKDMAWRIGNSGFEIALSSYVPNIIGGNIRSLVAPILISNGIELCDIDFWAIHPGGKAIVDKIEKELRLKPEHVKASRDVLRKYGNMSSATILFVINELLREDPRPAEGDARICAMAFGPGLTVESAILTRR